MVLGIAALVLFCCYGAGVIPAIIALVLAPGAKREIVASGGALSGLGQVKAGQITSVIALVLTVLGVIGDHHPGRHRHLRPQLGRLLQHLLTRRDARAGEHHRPGPRWPGDHD